MVHILTDIDRLLWILKQPEVFPFTGFENYDSIDPGKFIGEKITILTNEYENAVSIWEEVLPGIFEAHSLFTNDCRGREAIKVGKDMIEWMILHKDPLLLLGQTPIGNRAANWWNRQVGFTYLGDTHEPTLGLVSIYGIAVADKLEQLKEAIASKNAQDALDEASNPE